jgi:hypothetical protein
VVWKFDKNKMERKRKKDSNETLNFRLTFLLCKNMVSILVVFFLSFSLHVA